MMLYDLFIILWKFDADMQKKYMAILALSFK